MMVMMAMIDIQEEVNNLQLNPGDLLVDRITGSVGVLIERIQNSSRTPLIDYGYQYDVYFWKIFWMSNMRDSYFSYSGPSNVEEYGLKMSVVMGIYDYHSIDTIIKEEKI